MKRIILLTVLLTMFNTVTFSKQVDELTAKQIGKNFLTTLKSSNLSKSSLMLELAFKADAGNSNTTAKIQETTYFFVFNIGTNGFVIVAGDDNVTPILGYSDEGIFSPDNIPQNVKKWFEGYINQIRYTVDNNVPATQEIQEEWTNYLNGETNSASKIAASVNPLMQTKWNQSPYYNSLCPYNSVTGCVATAMAQIMKYWNYPAMGIGFHSYNHQTYGTLSANFGSTTYQWVSMPNTINSTNNAIATLMYHCGVSVDMNYSPQTSGAYVISSQSPVLHCSEYALKTYFGYKNTLQGIQRINYNQTQWLNVLKSELNASRPILYAGFGSGGGHCFVADGYDNNDYIHFNWGWGGAYDGFFQINALNPSGIGTGGGTGSYNNGHQAVIGIEPPTGGSTTVNYDLRLYSNLNMSATQIGFRTPFSLTVDVANFGSGSFSGQLGAAVFDNNNNFIDFIETQTTTIQNSTYKTYTFNNSGAASFVPGNYHAVLFYKTSSLGWTIVSNGSYTNYKSFKINYSSSIETNSAFSITTNGGKLTQGQSATVNVDVLNTNNTTFFGKYRVNLANLDGSWAQDIQVINENSGLPYNYHYTSGINFSGTITVAPGTYLMEVAYQSQGSPNWYYAGSTSYSNPIYVIVETPAISPDLYENNNNVGQAYTLPISFSGSIATKNTIGSNLHTGTDNDYYKINLTSGYKYTISARLHDSYNSGNGNIYSVDGLFSYSTDGSSWSGTYDDIMSDSIIVQNGGSVYFHVAPYFAGKTGTYLLDITISRATNTGINTNQINDFIKIYPNPASNFIHIDLKQFSSKVNLITILNNQGQEVEKQNVTNYDREIKLPLNNLPNGNYYIQVNSNDGISTEKIIIIR